MTAVRPTSASKFRHVPVFLAFLGAASMACTCDFNLGDIEDDYRNAAMVFRAKVIAVDHIPYMTTLSNGEHVKTVLIRVEVKVLSTFKGDTNNLIYVATDPSTCGASIIEGDDYIFFASDIAHVHLCGGSLAARNASAYQVDWADYVELVSSLSDR